MAKLELKFDAMVGVYGGTFDPVHFGHLRTVLDVKEALGLQQVRLVPCSQPVHRGQPGATVEQRFTMLQKATEGLSGFVIDSREMGRDQPSYMIETLRSLRKQFPQQPLLLIIGGDAFGDIEKWFQWQQLFDYAHVVVMQRPGSHFENVNMQPFLQAKVTHKATDLAWLNHGHLYFQPVIQLDISATQIRQKVARHESIDFLLPDNIIKYITDNDLYQGDFTAL
jgi:nicotinate-nucleotide adenylyltransferase